MAPPRGTKRKSDESASASDRVENAQNITEHIDATTADNPFVAQESPRKRQRTGITLSQKQALIDNLQLEIADRARKLRAQYNLQAQGLRTRIEIRVNRIPMALRKARMGDLADKYRNGQHPQQSRPTASAFSTSVSLPPPVPEKDTPVSRQTSQATSHTTASSKSGPGRPPKQNSSQVVRPDKENPVQAIDSEPVKKKQRSQPAPETEPTKHSTVLSPASANARPLPRTTPGGKPTVTRPGANTVAGPPSPVKHSSASNLFSNLAEKARSTRPGASPRKQTASTTASSAGGPARGRTAATTTATGATKGAATTKTTRRASVISESSEGSTSTVMRKGTTKGATSATDKEMAPPPSTKKSVMGSIRRGMTGGASKKTTAAKTAAPASTATGRVLRKRT
ncbi:hypothetical protein VMCG_01129 [Cytospora schulzeri]|uniref:Borealin N-terminal domain-containing protein n=1 Tax=Cytospora schulzeri TaxID=448051 RepID=A0A423X6I1_9PEZI|nr:hypothetical protein VMCG_01129 [Valsa malicola]